ncbi:2-amino-4-hydroxy-6-hydroxymethyldihydropteridine diphosphokinase [Undibacterium sp. KW1]|uniref:2-amino-4-hydroxy-6- hydroxymethyldihydropteridine diphosphokinase n=1 Tax=Undibacterium sp. KW1 TaxID=2058624 RepID=UPI001331EF0C|nr:2-amino-4-hydroxy-6-hydroxymethyldihydropteridine diphosphokinase [Undibacterium sp. KW1]BBB58928.1 2-amino-4-hydroxy-6-hydroxymethyldihydropteridine diphosphokinase [Undibacterium sp. KW1]
MSVQVNLQVFIGIGANLGDARASVSKAIDALAQLPDTTLVARSALFGSAPIDSSGDDYVNAVAELTTSLSAADLLQHLQAIELAHGRERPYRNAPRTLDLDLLLYGDEEINTADLQVPHPRMTERAFVLLPLLQLSADISIPGKGRAQDYVAAVAEQRIQELPIT